jgi:ComF family protein
MNLLENFIKSIRELFYPAVCLVCRAHLLELTEMHLCENCLADVRFIRPPLCTCCGDKFSSETGADHLCATCLTTPYFFSKARALLAYNDNAAHLIHSFKYGRKTAALSTFKAFWEKSGLQPEFQQADLILPVPLHLERLRWRGYNQALLLAELFFQEQREKINPFLLTRVKNTPPQTGLKGAARRKNILGAFAVKHPGQIVARKILLVDDVYTTGSTLNEAARTLMNMGAAEVQALTLARVQYH